MYGFTIAFAGTILFCGMALVLHYTNFTTRGQIKAELSIRMQNADARSSIQQSLEVYTQQYHEKALPSAKIESMLGFPLYYPTQVTISNY